MRVAFVAWMMTISLLATAGFHNPVLPGFHADPSVCRVGDDYYLVNSTFQYFPGVPVYHSKDLVNWEQIGNCLTRPSQVDLRGTDGNSGIYAPTIRCHNGRFYMVTTVFPSRRHFYVWTDNPAGEWSDPVVIDFAIGSCDPTLFFDDGKCYFLWKAAADETREGIKPGVINICEIDVETGKRLGEVHQLGTGLGGRYPEGPHIYKKDGYYYLLLAEGGTEHGHHVNILRSRSLFGPYESNPDNPILTHFNMKMQNSEIQGLGHADLVQAPDSTWWMICLGYRTSGYLQHVMGRETMLAPVKWDRGAWPVVNGDGTLQTDMNCPTLPLVPLPQDPVREEFNYTVRQAPTDSYHALGMPMGWMSLCNPDYTRYSLTERKGFLRLRPTTIDLSATASPTFVARRQTERNFTATALFALSHLTEGVQAGLTAYAAPLNHYDVVAEKRNGKIIIKSNVRLGQTSHSEKEIAIAGTQAWLRITSDKDFYYMQASADGIHYTPLAKMEYRFLSTETIGGFTGVMLGVFAQSSKEADKGYVDIDWFEYCSPCGPVPTENQLRWQDMEMYAFIHYSLNTYTDQEWGYGNEDPSLFNPSNLDCRQWARVCKQAGMKGIIFTAKHHCGFCMWPSAYTEYSVKNSPWKNGKGDVVRELADACREEGLEFAVYLSPWDRNHKDYGRHEYVVYFRNQLRELLTNYGDIFEVWFDGANGGDGWYGGANETQKIDRTTYYEWPETYRMIRELQPRCLIWNDGSDRGDLRWVGTEAGNVGETNWSLMPGKGDTPWHMLHYGVETGDVWCPGETNTSIRPGWFYHDTENEHVKSLSKLMDTYYKSVGRNSTLLLNFPIAPNGRIHPNDSLRGIAFKKMIDEVFKTDLAVQAKVKTDGASTIIDFGKPTALKYDKTEKSCITL